MRRFIGLLTSLLLLHLTLVGADTACAKHSSHGSAHAVQSEPSSHDGHHTSAAAIVSDHGDTSCEVPTLPACCQALASCGVSIAECSSPIPGDHSHLAAGVRVSIAGAPLSWTLAPDPPPPKA